MQNAAGDAGERAPHDQDDEYRAVVADLVRLIEDVQSSLRLIEHAIAGEAVTGGPESAGNVVVLDDVSPRYMTATAALHVCEANLDIALHSLRDVGDRHAMSPALSIVGA
ncbi:MAG: hypothetical protein PS018_27355 [bacterium]|nr:hypothetical protein [bacterium]